MVKRPERRLTCRRKLALETNIDRTYISGIERAKRNPSLELIVKLAKRLKTTPGKLLTPMD